SAADQPDERRAQDEDRGAAVHCEHTGQRRPAPVVVVTRRVVVVDHEQFADPAADEQVAHDHGQDGLPGISLHRFAPSYSRLSWVSCMNASSSDACCGASSYSTRPWAAASSAIRGASRPVTISVPTPSGVTCAPWPASSAVSERASGELTRTEACDPRAT